MRRRLALLWAVAVVLGTTQAAMADHWPMAGGAASRAGNASSDGGQTPITPAWMAADGIVRTPMLVTGGPGPDVQRVAYGTADGRLHLRLLSSGAAVGAPEGIDLDGGTINHDGEVFGRAGTVGFVDTSTETTLGQLLVVHNDDSLGKPNVFIAKIRLDDGSLVDEQVITTGLTDCAVDSWPLLTPATAAGGRILYFTMVCSAGVSRYLVRVPIEGDARSPSSNLGQLGFALVPDAIDTAAPSLVVLRDAAAVPRFHVVVPRRGGLSIFQADDPLEASPGNMATPAAITATLDDDQEIPQTAVAPGTASGEVAGGERTGTPPAPVLYVAARADGNTKVYRLVQDGSSRELRIDKAAGPLNDTGAPSAAPAVTETVTAAGLSAGGSLVVTSSRNATLLRTSDLSTIATFSSTPLPTGSGFARTSPLVSGRYAYLVRDGSAERAPEHLALRLDDLTPITAPSFAGAQDAAGTAAGEPAASRGRVLIGGAAGAFAYLTRDVTDPAVELLEPGAGAGLQGTVTLSARASDARGVEAVTFRLGAEGEPLRAIGRVPARDAATAYARSTYALQFPTASVANGDYLLEAVATDGSGRTASSQRRRVRVANSGGSTGLPMGACANVLPGSPGPDRIVGSTAGDRILGGSGDDRLDGAAGHDCILGQEGNDAGVGGLGNDLLEGDGGRDRLRGGRGADRIAGGSGNDVLRGESGNDRIDGGSGNDVLLAGAGSNRLKGGAGNDRISAVNGRRDVITCGRGRDRVVADRRDRVSRSCERVSRRGRR